MSKFSRQRFNAVQDASSETQLYPLVATPISAAEQLSVGGFPDFILHPPRRSTKETLPSGNDAGSERDDTFAMAPHDQDIGGAVPELLERVVRRGRPPDPTEHFIVLQRWEGTVSLNEADGFTADLRDLTDPTLPDEEVTLPLEEVDEDDQELVRPGAVFYWAIGYRTKLAGGRERVSAIRFRRLPRFTARDLRRIHDEAARIKQLFGTPDSP